MNFVAEKYDFKVSQEKCTSILFRLNFIEEKDFEFNLCWYYSLVWCISGVYLSSTFIFIILLIFVFVYAWNNPNNIIIKYLPNKGRHYTLITKN